MTTPPLVPVKLVTFVSLCLAFIVCDVISDSRQPTPVFTVDDWKLAIPEQNTNGGPQEIVGRELLSENNNPYFTLNESARFSVPVGGYIQDQSSFARSELREMDDGALAAWDSHSGMHTLHLQVSIDQVPPVRPSIVACQIHGTSHYVALLRLDGSRLYVKTPENPDGVTLDDGYVIGSRFTIDVVVKDGKATFSYSALGRATRQVRVPADCDKCYFKAGAYLQTNQGFGDSPESIGVVTIYRLDV